MNPCEYISWPRRNNILKAFSNLVDIGKFRFEFFEYAMRKRDLPLLLLLMKKHHYNIHDETIYESIVTSYDIEIFDYFLTCGLSLHQSRSLGYNQTPLMIAIEHCDFEHEFRMEKEEKERRIKFINYMVEIENDYNFLDCSDRNVLTYVSTIEQSEYTLNLVERLINLGCSMNIVDDDGRTPLTYAFEHNVPELIELFLKYNALVDIEGFFYIHGFLSHVRNVETTDSEDEFDIHTIKYYVGL